MKQLRQWLVTRFLPDWAKETLLEENERLRDALRQERAEHARCTAYLRGMEQALRHVRGVRIYQNGGAAHGRADESIV